VKGLLDIAYRQIAIPVRGAHKESVADIGGRTVHCSFKQDRFTGDNSPAETVTQHERTIANETQIAAVEAKWKN
jgi:hypothetical protein